VGGVAINIGTIPSKALREAILRLGNRKSATPRARDFASARNATFTEILHACHRVITAEVQLVNEHLASNGVELYSGTCCFLDPQRVRVTGATGEVVVSAEYFLIATGTRPSRPSEIPFDRANLITSDELLRLPYFPTP
jgi:NAD(P) transhydrogenase